MRERPRGAVAVSQQLGAVGLLGRIRNVLRAARGTSDVRFVVAWPEVVSQEGDELELRLVVQYERQPSHPLTGKPMNQWLEAEAVFAASLSRPFGPVGSPPLAMDELLVVELLARRLYNIH